MPKCMKGQGSLLDLCVPARNSGGEPRLSEPGAGSTSRRFVQVAVGPSSSANGRGLLAAVRRRCCVVNRRQ